MVIISWGGFNNRLHRVENRISEVKEMSTENVQTEAQRENKWKKKKEWLRRVGETQPKDQKNFRFLEQEKDNGTERVII